MDRKVFFISHAGPDKLFAFLLDERLRNQGHETILYERDFEPNEDFVTEISDALVDADYVICLVSTAYVSSNWCVKEYLISHQAQKLIRVLLEDCNTSNLPVFENFIDAKGIDNDTSLKIILEITQVQLESLQPLVCDSELTYRFVNKTTILLPLFRGGTKAEQWSRHAHPFIERLMIEDEVDIVFIPEVVHSEVQARVLLKKYNADIALYGTFQNQWLEIGFVSSRGWNLVSGGLISLPDNLKFKTKHEDFLDLTCVLKLAFGNLSLARGRKEKADKCFTEALGSEVPLARAYSMNTQYLHVLKGYIHYQYKQWNEAFDHFNLAIKIDPSLAIGYVGRGVIYQNFGDYPSAVEDANRAISLAPSYSRAYTVRGTAFYSLGKLDLALSDFDQALKLDSLDALTLINRAATYDELGNYSAAMEDLLIAVQVTYEKEFLTSAYSNLAALYVNLNDYLQAIASCAKSLAINPKFPSAYSIRGRAFIGIANWCEALSDFRRYEQLGGNSEAILNRIPELEIKCVSE